MPCAAVGAVVLNARNEDFNVVNGDVFRWKWMWPRIAEYFDIEAIPFDGVCVRSRAGCRAPDSNGPGLRRGSA